MANNKHNNNDQNLKWGQRIFTSPKFAAIKIDATQKTPTFAERLSSLEFVVVVVVIVVVGDVVVVVLSDRRLSSTLMDRPRYSLFALKIHAKFTPKVWYNSLRHENRAFLRAKYTQSRYLNFIEQKESKKQTLILPSIIHYREMATFSAWPLDVKLTWYGNNAVFFWSTHFWNKSLLFLFILFSFLFLLFFFFPFFSPLRTHSAPPSFSTFWIYILHFVSTPTSSS